MLGSSNFLVPNATFFVELAAFLLLLWALRRWVVPVVSKAMADRQAAIRQAIVDAEEARNRAHEAEAESKRVMTEARAQARAVVDEANRLSEQLRAEKRQQAEDEYGLIVGRARDDIDALARRATEELRQQVADLAVNVVEKVLADGLDPATHRSLVDRTIAEVEAQTAQTAQAGRLGVDS